MLSTVGSGVIAIDFGAREPAWRSSAVLHPEPTPRSQAPTFRFHPLAIHQYGDLRVREHLDRFAAEDDRRNTPTPPRRHHHAVALSRLGGFDNRLIDLFMLDVEGVANNTG